MTTDDLCPATNRECHNPVCATGGCRKTRARSAAPKPAIRRKVVPQASIAEAELKRLERELAEVAKLKAGLVALFTNNLEAIEHGDAALTYLQQSLGVKTSPRLDQLRSARSRMRDFLRDNALPEPTAAGSDDAMAKADREP